MLGVVVVTLLVLKYFFCCVHVITVDVSIGTGNKEFGGHCWENLYSDFDICDPMAVCIKLGVALVTLLVLTYPFCSVQAGAM